MHRPSGAHGYAEDSRKQLDNKRLAFERMFNTKEFQKWIQLETSRRTGETARIDQQVQQELRKIKVEVRDEEGRWVQVPKDAQLSDGE